MYKAPWRVKATWLCWSGGKESAWALRRLRAEPTFDVRGLIALVNEKNGRVLLHGIRHTLLEHQAAAVGLPLRLIPLDWTAPSRDNDAVIGKVFGELHGEGAGCVAFGNLYSPADRQRRLGTTAGTGLEPIFPLWDLSPLDHVSALLEAGVTAWVCSVDTGVLPAGRIGSRLVGSCLDSEFLANLPEDVDPSGENGEYHTFVEWAPGWDHSVSVKPLRSIEVYDFAFAEFEFVPEHANARAARPGELVAEARALAPSGPDEPRPDPFRYFERLARVRSHVDANLADQLNTESVARVAAMSAAGFSRFFHRYVGLSFGTWLAERRIEHACRMLRESNSNVAAYTEHRPRNPAYPLAFQRRPL